MSPGLFAMLWDRVSSWPQTPYEAKSGLEWLISLSHLSNGGITGMHDHIGHTCYVSVSSLKAAAGVLCIFKPWMQRTELPEKMHSNACRKLGGRLWGLSMYFGKNLRRASGIFDRMEWWTEFNKIKFNWNKCKALPLGPKGTGVGSWNCVEMQFLWKAWGAGLSGCSGQVIGVSWLPKTFVWP